MRKALPFIKGEYFSDQTERTVFEVIENYIKQYNARPTKEALAVELDSLTLKNQEAADEANELIGLLSVENTDEKWLIDNTEKFCQKRAIINAIMDSISIVDGKDRERKEEAIPGILQNALSVSFDKKIGHDYIGNANERFEFYHRVESKLPFDIRLLNSTTLGGVPDKTLNIIMAPTGVGKTLIMCHFAAANLMIGKNVLYITNEMAEERIAERIDANLLNIPLSELVSYPKEMYDRKIAAIRGKTAGNLIIKEYPTASAHVGHFRHLINELRLKKNFKPDVIYVDYLNICTSSRIKMGGSINSYTLIKAIAEELRGLAVEFGVPLWTATQTNRGGFADSDFDLDNVSESFGIPMTADYILGVITNEDLEKLGQLLFKQLKNRYNGKQNWRKFVVGVDYDRMRLYDVEQAAQDDVSGKHAIEDKSVFDQGAFAEADADWKKKKDKFKNFSFTNEKVPF
jgi:replicative DNA helicase